MCLQRRIEEHGLKRGGGSWRLAVAKSHVRGVSFGDRGEWMWGG